MIMEVVANYPDELGPTKINSAPTTPIDFHQNCAQSSSKQSPRPANSLPIYIRKIRTHDSHDDPEFASIRRAQSLLKSDEQDKLAEAECILTRSIDEMTRMGPPAGSMTRERVELYAYRAEANLKLKHYLKVIADCKRARQIDPGYTKPFFLEAEAQHIRGNDAEALGLLAQCLAKQPGNQQVLGTLIDFALTSDEFGAEFGADFNLLKLNNLDARPAVIACVLGQLVLNKCHYRQASNILESAQDIGMDEEKFKASLWSSLAHLYCKFKKYDKALAFMHKELYIHSQMGNSMGQCRVLNNLGNCYYKLNQFEKSLESHKRQKDVAFTADHLLHHVSIATNALGHVNMAKKDLAGALNYHQWCLNFAKQHDFNEFNQFKESLNIGHVHLMSGSLKAAEDKYKEAFQLLQTCHSKLTEEQVQICKIMVDFNLAFLALKKNSFAEAERGYKSILNVTKQMSGDKSLAYQMRAFMGLGHTYRLMGQVDEANEWFQKQVSFADQLGDLENKSHGLACQGMISITMKKYEAAIDYFRENLKLVCDHDPLLEAYAFSYLGSLYHLLNDHDNAHAYYQQSLVRLRRLDHCTAERKLVEANLSLVDIKP